MISRQKSRDSVINVSSSNDYIVENKAITASKNIEKVAM